MSVHNVEGEVERPHLVKDWMANVENDCIQSRVQEDGPEVVSNVFYVNQVVDQAQ